MGLGQPRAGQSRRDRNDDRKRPRRYRARAAGHDDVLQAQSPTSLAEIVRVHSAPGPTSAPLAQSGCCSMPAQSLGAAACLGPYLDLAASGGGRGGVHRARRGGCPRDSQPALSSDLLVSCRPMVSLRRLDAIVPCLSCYMTAMNSDMLRNAGTTVVLSWDRHVDPPLDAHA